MEGNNIIGEIAEYRDLFLKAQEEYLSDLKKNPSVNGIIKELNSKYDSTTLFEMVRKKVDEVRTGTIKGRELDRYELEITVMLAAIQDYVRGIYRERLPMEKNDEWER